jgi:hypothetical protein
MSTTIEERQRAAQRVAMVNCVRAVRERLDDKLDEANREGYAAELIFLALRDVRSDLEKLEETVPAIARGA